MSSFPIPLPDPITREEQILWHVNNNLNGLSASNAAIIAALQALQDNEMIKVYDSTGAVFAARAVFDEDSGALISWTYYNANGTIGVPSGVVSWIYGAQETPGFTIDNGAGTVTVGKKSVTIYNSGAGAATVLGTTLNPGLSISFSAQDGNTLGAIAYDGDGNDLIITTTE